MTKLTPLLVLALVAAYAPASDFQIRSQVLTVNEGKTRQLYLFYGKEFTHAYERAFAGRHPRRTLLRRSRCDGFPMELADAQNG